VDARLDDRLCGDRGERAPRCPRHQPARAGLPLTPLRRVRPSRQLRPLCLFGPARHGVVRRLGACSEGLCRAASLGGWAHPLRPRAVRPDRRAVNAERGVPRHWPRTTSASTTKGSSSSTTRLSASSSSATTGSSSPPIRGWRSSRTPPSPARDPRRPSACSPAGPPRKRHTRTTPATLEHADPWPRRRADRQPVAPVHSYE
jgi:hypothetical protein